MLLNVLLPAELVLRLKIEVAEFLVVVELKPAVCETEPAVRETGVKACDTGFTLATA